ncbi:peptidoglycan recognition protein [Streptomyces sp. B-S-A8]|uniref:Peptidoglycan recognition protein n=1 Tax=Streptomyces solicavernae TaxID=3043614 RepID=A0ABT6S0L8_9ACTN|nr:peptidoglycan recognition protein [Streptomyces sp. B-S-A8]MDI3390231.1 peptidoglycan recognition protein [Streptomyces sp. B-S-A8]
MRGYLASSIGVACAAALALPLAAPQDVRAAVAAPAAESAGSVPGSTQSLPLGPLTSDRAAGGAPVQGLTRRDVRPFSLVGVVWDDPTAELHGRVQVRTRATGTGRWSDWQDVDTHNQEHAADLDSPERAGAKLRGSTAPLWVGDSDGVEIRVESAPAEPATGHDHADHGPDQARQAPAGPGAGTGATGITVQVSAPTTAEPATTVFASLPAGLRLELVDPGDDPPTASGPQADSAQAPALSAEGAAASAVNADLAGLGAAVIPALTKEQTENDLMESRGVVQAADSAQARPYIGPRPRIVTRKGWGADEKLREKNFVYTKTVRAAFVHHSATGNNYRCSQAPSLLRSIYRYHVKSSGWRDLGYNFAVDKCGNIYEGRAGGVAKPVMGAHTLGFNTNTTGIAVLGTYSKTNPPKAAVNAVAKLTAWKLGLHGGNPRGTTVMTSGGSNLYKKGTDVRLNVISGHRDGFATECPGGRLYSKLGTARKSSARYQGR